MIEDNKIDQKQLQIELESIFPSKSVLFGEMNRLRIRVILDLIYQCGGRWKDE